MDAGQVRDQDLEMHLLLEAIYLKYGYDFRDYARAHTKRRLERRRTLEGLATLADMLPRLIHDEDFFARVLFDLSINVTEMFRDPSFYRQVRERIVPHLKTYPFIKVWHAGCATGQEVYSMAILLEEEGMKERARIYATDFNEQVLEKAGRGIYPIEEIRQYTRNYISSGGRESFSDYYTADDRHVILKSALRRKILFSSHNLVTDGVFGEMQAIFCRNVLIYFNRDLQERVLALLCASLCPGGFLCLGTKESLRFSAVAEQFEVVAETEKIYRKKRQKSEIRGQKTENTR